jgi:phage antirepressor YoqD-like protein
MPGGFMLSILASAFAMAIMQAQPQEIEASALPVVNGPMAPKYPKYSDTMHSSGDAQIRDLARMAGRVPAVALPDGDLIVSDRINNTAGWKAYQAVVPSGQTVKIRLKSRREAEFQVKTFNKWGRPEKGMLLNDFHQRDPGITYKNSSKETKTVYFVVINNLNMFDETFALHVTRK